MSIVFHCDYCGKKIEAPDSAGGRWGKCPACHNKLYVPSPDSDDEELKLAPIDETDLEREKRLLAETQRLTQDIMSETDIPDGQRNPTGAVYELSDKELKQKIIMYIRQTASGELDKAMENAALIAPCKKRATAILDRIALSEIPEPELEDIPQQQIAGSIRDLRAKLGR